MSETNNEHINNSESGILSAATLRGRVLSLPTFVAIAVGAILRGLAMWRIFDFDWDKVWNYPDGLVRQLSCVLTTR